MSLFWILAVSVLHFNKAHILLEIFIVMQMTPEMEGEAMHVPNTAVIPL